MTKRRSQKVFRSRKQSAAAGYVTLVVLLLLAVAAICVVVTMSPPPVARSGVPTARPDVRNTNTPRPTSVPRATRVPGQSCPRNCSTAVAAGMSAQEAGRCPKLDRDKDGVACYGD